MEHRFESSELVAQGVAQTSGPGVQSVSPVGTPGKKTNSETPKKKSLSEQGLGVECHPLALDDTSSGGGTRTPDTRIMIPLL